MEIIQRKKNYILRKAKLEDAKAILEISRDIDVMKYFGMAAFENLEKAREEVDWFLSLARENKGVRWVIADPDTLEYIGDIGLFNLENGHNRIELGFRLKKDYWRRGIMSSCIRKVLGYGFIKKGYNRIEALVDVRNIPCQKTVEKCGFKLEGTLREYELEPDGYVDLRMYSFLKKEYN